MAKFKKNPDYGKTIIFMHIPKTGGTTLQSLIRKQFNSSVVLHVDPAQMFQSLEEIKALPDTEKSKYQFIRGHMPFGLHYYLPQPATYITLLRWPVDRVISHYYHILRNPTHHHYHEVKTKKISLEEYVASGMEPMLDNTQTRLLNNQARIFFPDSQLYSYGRCPGKMLKQAKKNIDKHFSLVGTTERFDETLFLLNKIFGWQLPMDYKRMNENPNQGPEYKKDIPPAAIKVIEKYCNLDIQLYKYAEKKLESLMKSFA